MARAVPLELYQPGRRDLKYGDNGSFNVAKYLLDLDTNKCVFNFCGVLPFQLALTPKLREHLEGVASQGGAGKTQPKIFPATHSRMKHVPGVSQSAAADNAQIFHGREIRDVKPSADFRGGQINVLQLSLANDASERVDPEGWTSAEVKDYNGWSHDSGRNWRKGQAWEDAGFANFVQKYGAKAYGLHHRCYLHWDERKVMWLSAEDGCEGEPTGM